jgi:hypothetical protein
MTALKMNALTSFSFSSSDAIMTDDGMDIVSNNMAKLVKVSDLQWNVNMNRNTDVGLEKLVKGVNSLPKLTSLSLTLVGGSKFGSAICDAVSSIAHNEKGLTSLSLACDAQLAKSPHFINSADFSTIMKSIAGINTLQNLVLDFANNHIDDNGFASFLSAVATMPSLRQVYSMFDNDLSCQSCGRNTISPKALEGAWKYFEPSNSTWRLSLRDNGDDSEAAFEAYAAQLACFPNHAGVFADEPIDLHQTNVTLPAGECTWLVSVEPGDEIKCPGSSLKVVETCVSGPSTCRTLPPPLPGPANARACVACKKQDQDP